jgi:hypothetical protein
MLHVFYLDIAYILQWPFQALLGVFTSVLDVCCKCFNYFERMLQIFHLGVSKINRVLHLPPRLLLSHLGVSSSRCC